MVTVCGFLIGLLGQAPAPPAGHPDIPPMAHANPSEPGPSEFDPDHGMREETFRNFRTESVGEAMILEGNAFIERVLPNGMLRKLSEEEMAAYRAPFTTRESRKPTLMLPRELPIAGEPADVVEVLTEAHAALAASTYPKLLFVGTPGALVSPAFAADFAATLKHCAVLQLGPGAHYLQEDHPEAIGRSVVGWIAGIEAASAQRFAA